jgi:tetratricopeptide (TPR) repeat protein
MKPRSTSNSNGSAFWRRDWFLAALLVLATVIAYEPAWYGKPIWDDDAHITKPELRSFSGLGQIWAKPGATQQYYPIVHSVFWIEQKIWGDNVFPYHLVNILLHSLSALLLLRILRRLEVPGAWLAAFIFALHPVQVESVAWISELKNTLSGAFFFGAALIYLRFDRTRSSTAYITALLLFLLGLMSKSVIATLPAALLVVLWWKRGSVSWKRDLLPLLPFFVVGISAGLFTAWMERRFIGAHGTEFNFSIIERALIAGHAFWFYLFKLFWPANLTFIYPRWNVSQAISWQYLFPAAALLLLIALSILRRRSRAALASLLLFAGLLFPALGFFNVYPFVFSFVADHFQYLASVAVIALVAAGIVLAIDRWKSRFSILASVLPIALVVLLGALTWKQSRLYADPITLYRSTIERNPDCWMARNNLGNVLLQKGELEEALAHLQRSVELRPDDAEIQNNFGNALLRRGDVAEATAHYRKALDLRPDDAATHNNLGSALVRQGLTAAAIEHFQRALQLGSAFADRQNAEIHYNFGNALLQDRQIDEAIAQYRKAISLSPDYVEAHANLGAALQMQMRFADAIAEYERTLQIAPQSGPIRNNLATLLATCPDLSIRNGPRAVQVAQQALELSDGKDARIFRTLAAAYAESGQFAEAANAAEQALQLAGDQAADSWRAAVRAEMESYRAGHRPKD